MPSAEPTRLTDDLWLAAHDGVKGARLIGDWPLGVGLAAGLLAESVQRGYLELREGELFRRATGLPEDPALRPVLVKMEAEEQSWLAAPPPPLPPAWPRAAGRIRDDDGWGPRPSDRDGRWPQISEREGQGARTSERNGQAPQASERDSQGPRVSERNGPVPRVSERDSQRPRVSERDSQGPRVSERDGWSPAVEPDTRHRLRGHDLGVWLAYLAYDGRAEALVVDRLSRTGLVQREERRRLFGGTTVRHVPRNSYASGSPANTITHAVQNGRVLPWPKVFLAGLFLATGLHHHALATLSPSERSLLARQIEQGLHDDNNPRLKAMSRELLRAADAAVGEAAMR